MVQAGVRLAVELRLLLPFALPLRPNSFVIITANRVLHCNADTPEEMHHWITLLQRSKGDTRVEGQEFIVRGWLHKEVKNSPKASSLKLKKRWFVLTHNSLDYYKSSEKNALKLGTLVLNSLCSVVPPDEKIFKETGNRGSVFGAPWPGMSHVPS